MQKSTKQSVSLIVTNDEEKIFLVQRPPGDDDLPNAWGLPAGTLQKGETWENGVLRAGREKLGVELRISKVIAEGKLKRKAYVLQMKLFAATIPHREQPYVPQPHPEVTQYANCKWETPGEVRQALKRTAPKGSLCCMLYLRQQGIINEEWMKKHQAEYLPVR